MPDLTPAGLREQIAEALRTAPSVLMDTPEERDRHTSNPRNHHIGHHYYWGCAMCRGEVDTLADAVLAVVQAETDQLRTARQAELDHLGFLRAAVDLIRRADLPSEQILLGIDGERISIAVNISDVFAWGCADAEDITPERLPVLQQAWLDCETADDGEWIAELYAARVRGMRPQGAAYPSAPAVAALFDACGPERPTGLGNPHKPPAPKEASP
jgi:hypothetical protein